MVVNNPFIRLAISWGKCGIGGLALCCTNFRAPKASYNPLQHRVVNCPEGGFVCGPLFFGVVSNPPNHPNKMGKNHNAKMMGFGLEQEADWSPLQFIDRMLSPAHEIEVTPMWALQTANEFYRTRILIII